MIEETRVLLRHAEDPKMATIAGYESYGGYEVLKKALKEIDPEWIVNRTGIHERRFALPHQATSDLCVEAVRRCLDDAECDPSEVDMLVLATFTPDMARAWPTVIAVIVRLTGLRPSRVRVRFLGVTTVRLRPSRLIGAERLVDRRASPTRRPICCTAPATLLAVTQCEDFLPSTLTSRGRP